MAHSYSEFSNPDLVAIYDSVNPIGSYADFYLELAYKLGARKIIDLGCGTGLLSHEFAKAGCDVTGVEPAPAMLEQAKQKYNTEAQWMLGSAEALSPDMQADLLVMTGHVAQFFLEDTDWQLALQNMQAALKPGGYLAFESRNPHIRPFTGWPTKDNRAKIVTPLGRAEWWSEGLVFAGSRATYDIHYRFTETRKELVSSNTLRFRTKEELTKTMQDAGFLVEHIYGNWNGDQFKPDSREMIFVAKAQP